MTTGKNLPSVCFGALLAVLLAAPLANAEDKVDPVQAEAVTEGQPERYSLVAVDGDILRVDRQNGTVSVCREQNNAWRCNPVPLAEDAYLAEINELAQEVDRLTTRLEELGSGQEEAAPPVTSDEQAGEPTEETKPDQDETLLSEKDEEELEKVLTFTESAMRRFFGMVRDLQKEFDSESGNN